MDGRMNNGQIGGWIFSFLDVYLLINSGNEFEENETLSLH